MNQFWTFQCIFLNNFKDFLEAYSLLKICKIVLEHTLKCSQLISSSDNKKILLTTRNVRLDSGRYATKYYYIFTVCLVLLIPRTTDTQWRHKSKISENLGRCGRQNMLPPYLKIWEWEWIFGRAVKAISSLGVRSPWCRLFILFEIHCFLCPCILEV